MTLERILSFAGAFGLGAVLGVIVKSVVDIYISKRQMLFDARVRAYAGITGRVLNLCLEPDITALPYPLRFAKIGSVFSEATLLGSPALVDILTQYNVKVRSFHEVLGKDETAERRLHDELVPLAAQVCERMRADLGLRTYKSTDE